MYIYWIYQIQHLKKRCEFGQKMHIKKVQDWAKIVVRFGKQIGQKRCKIGKENDLPKGANLGKIFVQSRTFFGEILDKNLTFQKRC